MGHMTPMEMAIVLGAVGGLLGHIARHHAIVWPDVIRHLCFGIGGGIVFVEGARAPHLFLGLVGGYGGAELLARLSKSRQLPK